MREKTLKATLVLEEILRKMVNMHAWQAKENRPMIQRHSWGNMLAKQCPIRGVHLIFLISCCLSKDDLLTVR